MAGNYTQQELEHFLALADEVAARAHAGQVDRGGRPYIEHPRHVSAECQTMIAKIAALLHDTVEDTDVTLDDLTATGFPPEVVEAVDLLTHRDGVPYLDYVKRAGSNPIAREVKIADLHHNLDVKRLGNKPTEKDLRRIQKYHKALKILGAE
ncbi:MAG: HD domain-containing protein [Atopobiaceae bacterium]